DEIDIQVEPGPTESRHPGLARAEEVSLSPEAKILFSDSETIFGPGEYPESLDGFPGLGDGDAVTLLSPAANPAAELMELREPETLGMLDHHHSGVRYIDTDLDDRR